MFHKWWSISEWGSNKVDTVLSWEKQAHEYLDANRVLKNWINRDFYSFIV